MDTGFGWTVVGRARETEEARGGFGFFPKTPSLFWVGDRVELEGEGVKPYL